MGIAPVSIQLGTMEDGKFRLIEAVPLRNATGTSKAIPVYSYGTVRITNMGYSENIVYIAFGDSTITATKDSVPIMPGVTEFFEVSSHTYIAIVCGDQNSSDSSESSESTSSESSESSESSKSSTSTSSESTSSESSESSDSSESSTSTSSTSTSSSSTSVSSSSTSSESTSSSSESSTLV
jgi:hypothetical protein